MHKSKLAGISIDCKTDDLSSAAEFWAQALGAPAKHETRPATNAYINLGMQPGEPYIEVQSVEHASRVHLDIEADDIPAEVARLEALGATKIAEIRDWTVMEAPTGQRFCIVPVESTDFEEKARRWSD